ncbi:MAG: hypothetical protein M5U29_17215 [Anaerolineae bacterium]|nr:hypothetical protein [Anaerolineae bacterium]
MTRGSRAGEWAIRFDPYLVYTIPLDVCLDDYSHVAVTLAVPLDVADRTLQVYYILDGRGEFSEIRMFQVPLANTGEVQTYVYPTSRFPHTRGSRLTGIRLDPAEGSMAQAGRVTITDFRLIRSNTGPSLCRAAEAGQVFAVVKTTTSHSSAPFDRSD